MDADVHRLRALMRQIDACYTGKAYRRVLDLEEELERRLWALEYHLQALDEDEEIEADDGDPDGEVGVEEQYVALWYAYCNGGPSFAGDAEASEGHLRDVLKCACMNGMAPHGLKLNALPALLPIAAELARGRRALIARYRADSRRFAR